MGTTIDLAGVWYGVLGLFLVLYVVLDGFTLGVGILSLITRNGGQRETMMGSLESVWDANETWLVVFAGALFGAFPQAYAIILHGLYIPVMIMLFALIFRGVAFEYRQQSRYWRLAFGGGSLLAAVAQGFALGALLSGIPLKYGVVTGGIWHWLTPFAALTAAGVVSGYALLGASYLVMKTVGALQTRSARLARAAAWLTMLVGAGVSLWTPLRFEYVFQRWFGWPGALYLAPLPIAAALCFVLLLRALRRHDEYAPFLLSIGIFVTSFGGLAVTFYPYLIPTDLTIWHAAASHQTLAFMLFGIGILIPVMLIYNAYQYRVFRGKVHAGKHDYE